MKTLKLLLTETIDNLGIVGDVVQVRPGFARNFLLPRGYATDPSQGNINRLAARRAEVEKELAEKRAQLEVMLAKLEGHEVTLERSANEQGILYGGISQHDVAEMLRAEGFQIDDRAVRLGDQIKRLDSYTVPLVLAADLKTEIKLWVVSDKPLEELDGAEAAEGSAQEGGEQNADEQQAAAPVTE